MLDEQTTQVPANRTRVYTSATLTHADLIDFRDRYTSVEHRNLFDLAEREIWNRFRVAQGEIDSYDDWALRGICELLQAESDAVDVAFERTQSTCERAMQSYVSVVKSRKADTHAERRDWKQRVLDQVRTEERLEDYIHMAKGY